ncbi:response regulator [Acidobacteriota bacterium]
MTLEDLMSSEKIMIVDDEQDFIDSLSERMKIRGMKVVTATSGNEAVELVGKSNFDAILLDMMMPGLDGLETLKLMLSIDRDLQVIMLTGHATVQSGVEAMKVGAKDYIEKPADIEKLVELIRQAKIRRMVIKEKKSEEAAQEILKKRGW